MAGFVGRANELAILDARLRRIEQAGAGVAMAVRGRRQVGKSRLVQEFCTRSGWPYVYFTAVKGAAPTEAIADFLSEIRNSPLQAAATVPDHASSWSDAFRALSGALANAPAIVVLDEVPWAAEQDRLFDGSLQNAWDRWLAGQPIMLLLLGSDVHMMERLTAYDRPFFGRADNMVLGPLNPADVARALDLPAVDAIDAHLITGGLPGILRSWPPGMTPLNFIERECADPAAPVFSVPESSLFAEFPTPDQSRRVLEAVGSGDRTHTNIAATVGGSSSPLPSGTLSPILRRLVTDKRVLAVDDPVSTRPGKPALYRVADSNLRLYLAVLRAVQTMAQRGRPDGAFRIFQRRWTTVRGRVVEPLIREALELAASNGEIPWQETEFVGGWWNRQFDPEIDLVGVDRERHAKRIDFVGSVKWLHRPFDKSDYAALHKGAVAVPGFVPTRTGLVVVSRSGVVDHLGEVDLVWGPDEVVGAWGLSAGVR